MTECRTDSPRSSLLFYLAEHLDKLERIERLLRSISYVIPGRFKDAEMTAEIVYALLNLFNAFNRQLSNLYQSDSDAKKHLPIRARGWNEYLKFMRMQSPLVDRLMTFLNISFMLEVPIEMILWRIVGLRGRNRYIILLELAKVLARLVIWASTGFRPLPHGLMAAREVPGSVDEPESFSAKAMLAVNSTDPSILMPETTFPSAMGSIDVLREVSHLIRPFVYVLLVYGVEEDGRIFRSYNYRRWLAWCGTCALDVFAEWPSISEGIPTTPLKKLLISGHDKKSCQHSPIYKNERLGRLFRMLLYLLREPYYSAFTKGYIVRLIAFLESWRILRPAALTLAGYQKLWEKVEYYTLGS